MRIPTLIALLILQVCALHGPGHSPGRLARRRAAHRPRAPQQLAPATTRPGPAATRSAAASQPSQQLLQLFDSVAGTPSASRAGASATQATASASAASAQSIGGSVSALFDRSNRLFPLTVAVTALIAFIGCLIVIAILKFICHRPRFDDRFSVETDRQAVKTAAGFDLRMPPDRKERGPPLTEVPAPRRPRKDRHLKPPKSRQIRFVKLPPPPPLIRQPSGSPRPTRPRAPSSRETSPMLGSSAKASPHVRQPPPGHSPRLGRETTSDLRLDLRPFAPPVNLAKMARPRR